MTIPVWTESLAAARDGWEEQSTLLSGPLRNLSQATSARLGSRVGPAAAGFLETWADRIDTLRRMASLHADELSAVMHDFHGVEAAQVERIQELLVWADRDVQPLTWGSRP